MAINRGAGGGTGGGGGGGGSVTQGTTPWVVDSSGTTDLTGTGSITAVDAASTTVSGQGNASVITGTPTANSFATIALAGRATIGVVITGTWVGTLSFERSEDGGTTWGITGLHVAGAAASTAAPTANGTFHGAASGVTNFRVRCTAYTSGTATVKFAAGFGTSDVYVTNALKVLDGAGTNQLAITAAGAALVGGVGHTALPTPVSDGTNVAATFDKVGRLATVGSIRVLKAPQTTTITASTAETTIGTAVASTFLDLYGVIITNTSGTATTVTLKDSTAGTTRFVIASPANSTVGFAFPESGAWPQAAVNNNWTATSSASVTSLVISAQFVQNV